MDNTTECGKMGYFKKVCCSKISRAINEIEIETSQEYSEGEIEMASRFSTYEQKSVIINCGVRDACRQ